MFFPPPFLLSICLLPPAAGQTNRTPPCPVPWTNNTEQCSAVQCSAGYFSALNYPAQLHCNAVQYTAVEYSTVQ